MIMQFWSFAILVQDGKLLMHSRWPKLPMCFPTRAGAADELPLHPKAVKVIRVQIDVSWSAKP